MWATVTVDPNHWINHSHSISTETLITPVKNDIPFLPDPQPTGVRDVALGSAIMTWAHATDSFFTRNSPICFR